MLHESVLFIIHICTSTHLVHTMVHFLGENMNGGHSTIHTTCDPMNQNLQEIYFKVPINGSRCSRVSNGVSKPSKQIKDRT